MLSSAVFQGMRASTWNMYEASRLRPSVSGCPNTLIVPDEGFMSPAATFRSVDFPHPVGPTTERNSPSRTVMSTSRTAV